MLDPDRNSYVDFLAILYIDALTYKRLRGYFLAATCGAKLRRWAKPSLGWKLRGVDYTISSKGGSVIRTRAFRKLSHRERNRTPATLSRFSVTRHRASKDQRIAHIPSFHYSIS
jgi:hypothetical protein